MKIWRIRLSLCGDGRGNWFNFFDIETDDKDYKLINGTYYSIEQSWVSSEIPSRIKVSRIASGYLVERGFTKHPTKEELGVIEYEMKHILNEYIENELMEYKLDHNSKINGLFSKSK